MRHALLTLFLSLALTASGLAWAGASFACPTAQPAATAAQDCCPEDEQAPSDNQIQHDMKGCVMGMACRAGPVVGPSLAAPIRAETASLSISGPILTPPAPPGGPLQELFRPPRTT